MPNKPQKGRPCSGMVFLFVICRKVKRQSKLHSKRDKPLKDCRKRGFYPQLPLFTTNYHYLPPFATTPTTPRNSPPQPTQIHPKTHPNCVVACPLLFFPGALRAIKSSHVRLVSVAAVRGCSRGGSRGSLEVVRVWGSGRFCAGLSCSPACAGSARVHLSLSLLLRFAPFPCLLRCAFPAGGHYRARAPTRHTGRKPRFCKFAELVAAS